MYVKNNGLGKFLNTTGIVFLVVGVLIFIYFLSIDPGYGWVKSMDLSKNYIMIFTSMAVGILGIVLIVSGQQIHELRIETLSKKSRCHAIIKGNAKDVLKNDWFRLRDWKEQPPVKTYLFQNKGNRNNYKLVATINNKDSTQTMDKLIISSDALLAPLIVENKQSACPEVIEVDISIDYTRHEELNELVSFSITVVVHEKWTAEEDSASVTKKLQFTLKNKLEDAGEKQELSSWQPQNPWSKPPVIYAN